MSFQKLVTGDESIDLLVKFIPNSKYPRNLTFSMKQSEVTARFCFNIFFAQYHSWKPQDCSANPGQVQRSV